MAIVVRRYVLQGPSKLELFLEIGGSLGIPDASYFIARDIQFDDAVADPAFVDEFMLQLGYLLDTKNTIALAPLPFLGLIDSVGAVWRLQVDLLGVVTTTKVS